MTEQRPTFTNLDGTMTKDGQQLIEWLESQFLENGSEADLAKLNALSGDVKHYYVNVYKLNKMGGGAGGISPEKWLSDYKNSIALNAYRNYQFNVERQVKESQLEETSKKTAALESGLAELREALATKVAELVDQNKALREEVDAMKAKRGRPRKQAEEDTEEETPESEA
jgi:hypothetical protein